MKHCFKFLSFVLCIFILFACGDSNNTSSEDSGSIAFNIEWKDAPTTASDTSLQSKSETIQEPIIRAASIDCTVSGINTIQAIVYNSSNNQIASESWSCSAHSGLISVPVGSSLNVIILGKDSSGNIKYRGEKSGITVTGGQTTDVGVITMINISSTTAPSAPTGVSATAGSGQISISWTSVSGAASYNIYWTTASGVTKTTGTKITGATSPYTHTGLTNGTTYYYVVTAVNSYGESSESSVVSQTVAISDAGDTSSNAVLISTNNTSYSHEINPVGDLDWFKFEATGGVTYTISITNILFTDFYSEYYGCGIRYYALYLNLYDGALNYIQQNHDSAASSSNLFIMTYTAAVSGTFYLRAGIWDECTGSYNGTTGSYRISIR